MRSLLLLQVLLAAMLLASSIALVELQHRHRMSFVELQALESPEIPASASRGPPRLPSGAKYLGNPRANSVHRSRETRFEGSAG